MRDIVEFVSGNRYCPDCGYEMKLVQEISLVGGSDVLTWICTHCRTQGFNHTVHTIKRQLLITQPDFNIPHIHQT